MDLGLYKKIFSTHFANYTTNEKACSFNPQKSFQNFYHHVVFVSDKANKDNRQKFSDYLKHKKDADQIKFLDRSDKVLESLLNLLDSDHKLLRGLDYSKVSPYTSTLKPQLIYLHN